MTIVYKLVAVLMEISISGSQLTYRSLKRGCLSGMSIDQARPCTVYEESTPEGDATFKLRCQCSHDRCNALGPNPLLGLALYLPLDGDVNDASGRLRHANNQGVQFDAYMKKKSMSAYFDGNSYLIIPGMNGYLPGLITK